MTHVLLMNSRVVSGQQFGQRPSRGFSLIELLVVIGIMALMIGALGLSLRGSGSVGLQSAQGTVASLVSNAQRQATLKQGVATLAIDADPASEGFLRTVHVFVLASGSGNFEGEATLPSGVYFVPGSSGVTGAVLSGGWPSTRLSTLSGMSTLTVNGKTGNYFVTTFNFDATGKLSSTGGDKLILSPARRTSATTILFENPAFIRGVTLSAYGATVLINDATSFDN